MLFSQYVVTGSVALMMLTGSSMVQTTLKTPAPGGVTIANTSARLVLQAGGVRSLTLRDGRELLERADARLMLVRVGNVWHGSSSLAVDRDEDVYRLRVGFEGTEVTRRELP